MSGSKHKNKKAKKKAERGQLQLSVEGDKVDGDKRSIQDFGGSYVEGKINIKHGSFVGRDQHVIATSHSHRYTLFQSVYCAITNRPNTNQKTCAEIEACVKEIESEAQKGEKANERFLAERLQNLKRMAPDIWEVVLATLSNPIAGFSSIITKVAKKMAKEGEAQNDETAK